MKKSTYLSGFVLLVALTKSFTVSFPTPSLHLRPASGAINRPRFEPKKHSKTPTADSRSSSALRSVLATLDAVWRNQPYLVAGIICAVKASTADLVAQNRQGVQFDSRRNISFLLYGAIYQGIIQEFIYNQLYTRLFGSATTFSVVIRKVLFDAMCHNALVCIPMSYIVKSLVFGYSVPEALKQYVDDVLHHGLLLKYYMIWMPVNFFIYSCVPKHLRISTMATVSFFWMIILSTVSSRQR